MQGRALQLESGENSTLPFVMRRQNFLCVFLFSDLRLVGFNRTST